MHPIGRQNCVSGRLLFLFSCWVCVYVCVWRGGGGRCCSWGWVVLLFFLLLFFFYFLIYYCYYYTAAKIATRHLRKSLSRETRRNILLQSYQNKTTSAYSLSDNRRYSPRSSQEPLLTFVFPYCVRVSARTKRNAIHRASNVTQNILSSDCTHAP